MARSISDTSLTFKKRIILENKKTPISQNAFLQYELITLQSILQSL